MTNPYDPPLSNVDGERLHDQNGGSSVFEYFPARSRTNSSAIAFYVFIAPILVGSNS